MLLFLHFFPPFQFCQKKLFNVLSSLTIQRISLFHSPVASSSHFVDHCIGSIPCQFISDSACSQYLLSKDFFSLQSLLNYSGEFIMRNLEQESTNSSDVLSSSNSRTEHFVMKPIKFCSFIGYFESRYHTFVVFDKTAQIEVHIDRMAHFQLPNIQCNQLTLHKCPYFVYIRNFQTVCEMVSNSSSISKKKIKVRIVYICNNFFFNPLSITFMT